MSAAPATPRGQQFRLDSLGPFSFRAAARLWGGFSRGSLRRLLRSQARRTLPPAATTPLDARVVVQEAGAAGIVWPNGFEAARRAQWINC